MPGLGGLRGPLVWCCGRAFAVFLGSQCTFCNNNDMKRGAQALEDGELDETPAVADQLHAMPPADCTRVHKKKKRKKIATEDSVDVINQVYGPKVGGANS